MVFRELKQAQCYFEDLGEGIGLEMVPILGGSFMMGTENQEIKKLIKEFNWKGFVSERPQHKVNVCNFFIGKYLITQSQWKVVSAWEQVERRLNPDPSEFTENYKNIDRWKRPVENISWEEAKEFCARLNKNKQGDYRFPTEAEWEYACRARTNTPFYFGDTISTDFANYRGTDWHIDGKLIYSGNYGKGLKGIYREETTPVGYFGVANNFGLYDMHGNVWEWCEDDYHKNYKGAPNDGSAWLSEKPTTKSLRGGSWCHDPASSRSALRGAAGASERYPYVGFRVVCATPYNL